MNPDVLSAVAAITAVFLSVISMIFTVIFSAQQIKHNKNSVRPLCHVIPCNDDCISVNLLNVGTGPLIIERLICEDGANQIQKTLVPWFSDICTEDDFEDYIGDIAHWPIGVGGKVTLIGISPKDEETRNRVCVLLKQITIQVIYSDIYGRKFETKKDLSWFGKKIDTISEDDNSSDIHDKLIHN